MTMKSNTILVLIGCIAPLVIARPGTYVEEAPKASYGLPIIEAGHAAKDNTKNFQAPSNEATEFKTVVEPCNHSIVLPDNDDKPLVFANEASNGYQQFVEYQKKVVEETPQIVYEQVKSDDGNGSHQEEVIHIEENTGLQGNYGHSGAVIQHEETKQDGSQAGYNQEFLVNQEVGHQQVLQKQEQEQVQQVQEQVHQIQQENQEQSITNQEQLKTNQEILNTNQEQGNENDLSNRYRYLKHDQHNDQTLESSLHNSNHRDYVSTYNSDVYSSSDVVKNFYFYTAPEEQEDLESEIRVLPGKKRINVLFVKAPTYGHIVKGVLPVHEEKTVVYVLVKKPDELQYRLPDGAKLVKQTKPDVFYIKYKTQAEAEEAVRRIQSGSAAKGVSINARILGNDNEFLRNIQSQKKVYTNVISSNAGSRHQESPENSYVESDSSEISSGGSKSGYNYSSSKIQSSSSSHYSNNGSY